MTSAGGLAHRSVDLVSERFAIRTLKPQDVGEDYVGWFSDPVVQPFISYRLEVDAIGSLRRFVESHDSRDDSLLFGVFEPGGRHIANMKYEPIDLSTQRAVLGVLIGDQGWRGLGLFQEVFRATSRFLARNCGIEWVELGLSVRNVAARRAYERAGFTQVTGTPRGEDSIWMECRIKS